jgi:hypothetical protein
MKIRILGNTIRLRVKMHEVDAIRENGVIEEALAFGPDESDQLRFQIHTGDDTFAIEQQAMTISITIPRPVIDVWTSTQQVGFDQTITTTKGSDIYVLIEKDFACLDGDREEEAGSYPNPMEDTTC